MNEKKVSKEKRRRIILVLVALSLYVLNLMFMDNAMVGFSESLKEYDIKIPLVTDIFGIWANTITTGIWIIMQGCEFVLTYVAFAWFRYLFRPSKIKGTADEQKFRWRLLVLTFAFAVPFGIPFAIYDYYCVWSVLAKVIAVQIPVEAALALHFSLPLILTIGQEAIFVAWDVVDETFNAIEELEELLGGGSTADTAVSAKAVAASGARSNLRDVVISGGDRATVSHAMAGFNNNFKAFVAAVLNSVNGRGGQAEVLINVHSGQGLRFRQSGVEEYAYGRQLVKHIKRLDKGGE